MNNTTETNLNNDDLKKSTGQQCPTYYTTGHGGEEAASPVARVQTRISDRPFSEGMEVHELVVLDSTRIRDGMELYAAALPVLAQSDNDIEDTTAVMARDYPDAALAHPVAGDELIGTITEAITHLEQESPRAAQLLLRKLRSNLRDAATQPAADQPARHYRKATTELSLPELAEQFAAVAALGCDYTLSAGTCAKLHAAMTTQPAAAPAEVTKDQAVLLAGIQALCIAANQECARNGGVLPEWDKGWLMGQLHIFDMYTDVEKSAIAEARAYVGKLSANKPEVAPSAIATWQERCKATLAPGMYEALGDSVTAIAENYMASEIADLRAALASHSAAPVDASAPDLSAAGLLKLWRKAEAEATEVMPAPFQFARLLLAAPDVAPVAYVESWPADRIRAAGHRLIWGGNILRVEGNQYRALGYVAPVATTKKEG